VENCRDIRFCKRTECGDAVVANEGENIKIFYSTGIVVDKKYLVGNYRFIKDPKGKRRMGLLEQHSEIPPAIRGNYRKIEQDYIKGSFQFDFLESEKIIRILRGIDTFRFNSQQGGFEKMLAREFPGVDFSEIGSSNVGLNSENSDIDIYIGNDYLEVLSAIKESPERFGFRINQDKFREEVKKHSTDYGLSDYDSKAICLKKLAGLEYKGKPIEFFDNKRNPSLLRMFQINDPSNFEGSGEISVDDFAGHSYATYGIETTRFILLRGFYKKEKRHILKVGDKVKVKGKTVNPNQELVIAEDIIINSP